MGVTVDIDIGGKKLGDEDEDLLDEDIEEVEEVEVVETVEEPLQKPIKVAPPPAAVKKPSPWAKRILIVVVVVILIIVAIFAFVFFTTKVNNIDVQVIHTDPVELEVNVLASATGMASIAGDADLEITYNDDVVYTTKVSLDDSGNGKTYIPYTDFVEGNGNYYVQAKYKGKDSPPTEYQVQYIVESINITANVARMYGSGQLNLTVLMLDEEGDMMADTPRGVEITIDEIKNLDDNSIIPVSGTSEDVTQSYYREEFSTYNQAGNYSITVTVENTRINPTSDSPYLSITETTVIFLNIRPIVEVFYTHLSSGASTYTVEFDAGLSWNDGDITQYIWDFGDGNTYSETDDNYPDGAFDGKTTHTYSRFGTTVGANLPTGSYLATINVKGDIVDPLTDEVEVGALTVRVDPP